MPGSTIGQLFRLTSFGESHGAAIGGVVDGCPAGLELDLVSVQGELDRRRPGSTPLGTTRNEADRVEWLSGLYATPVPAFAGMTTRSDITLGTPIGFLIRNTDAKSSDYDALKDVYRPGHADRSWEQKFGLRDHRGGGRSSARTTAACVVGGAIARQLLAGAGVRVNAYVSRVGEVHVLRDPRELDLNATWASDVRCPDTEAAALMRRLIEQVRAEGDSIGGMVRCVVQGLPAGLGDPVFDKLDADLAKAMLSINASKGFQIGSGFAAAMMRGSAHNDGYWIGSAGEVDTRTNHSGGTLGGISTGGEIYFDVAFKPPATIAQAQHTVNTEGKEVVLEARGRHDPCVVPRAVPIVEAMACLVLADHWLRQRVARV
ncbi:MAG: chorismate synthase [Flavobacteriales bacterium]|nr:chorismate synthase [Flavobacteriales bacterium]